jgi:hypothetical protein
LRAGGNVPKYQCYLDAFRTSNKGSAQSLATRLEKRQEIQAEILRLKKATETEITLRRSEKREYLARVVRSNFAELSEDSDLLEEVHRFYHKDGRISKVVLKVPSKVKCIEIDNRMAGHNEPEKANVNHCSGVMILPYHENQEKFEADLIERQRRLKKKVKEMHSRLH